jgi:hypothetical protein
MSKLADKKNYLEIMTQTLKEAQAGNIPERHKDGVKFYIMFLEKEIKLMEKILNGELK